MRFARRSFHVLTRKEGREALMIFMFDTFTGRFPSNTLVSIAVKGLNHSFFTLLIHGRRPTPPPPPHTHAPSSMLNRSFSHCQRCPKTSDCLCFYFVLSRVPRKLAVWRKKEEKNNNTRCGSTVLKKEIGVRLDGVQRGFLSERKTKVIPCKWTKDRKGAGTNGEKSGRRNFEADITIHTPGTAFQHLPPKEGCRKPVPGVCTPL